MTCGGRVYRLSEAEIGWIRTLSEGGADVGRGLNLHHALRAGQWASVSEGPFSGMMGYVETICGNRASVLMEMLGVRRSVEMPLEALEVA